MIPTDVIAGSIKVSVPIADSDFPVAVVPPKGAPGSAKARVLLRIRTSDGLELIADPAAKGLQRALDAARATPGGYWVAQGRLGVGGSLLEVGVIYQPPKAVADEQAALPAS